MKLLTDISLLYITIDVLHSYLSLLLLMFCVLIFLLLRKFMILPCGEIVSLAGDNQKNTVGTKQKQYAEEL
jgi:hypothetical protein